MKTFPKSVTHNNQRCDLVHFSADSFSHLEDERIEKVHAVCFNNGKLLLVNHLKWNIWGIPGGTREQGESLEETLVRELQEETNCLATSFVPISYEKVIEDDGTFHYRVHFFCSVEPLGKFDTDIAGSIDKIGWIDPKEFETYIEDKEFKKLIIQKVVSNFDHYANL